MCRWLGVYVNIACECESATHARQVNAFVTDRNREAEWTQTKQKWLVRLAKVGLHTCISVPRKLSRTWCKPSIKRNASRSCFTTDSSRSWCYRCVQYSSLYYHWCCKFGENLTSWKQSQVSNGPLVPYRHTLHLPAFPTILSAALQPLFDLLFGPTKVSKTERIRSEVQKAAQKAEVKQPIKDIKSAPTWQEIEAKEVHTSNFARNDLQNGLHPLEVLR